MFLLLLLLLLQVTLPLYCSLSLSHTHSRMRCECGTASLLLCAATCEVVPRFPAPDGLWIQSTTTTIMGTRFRGSHRLHTLHTAPST
uniref:Putative secreted protein n=1 Tax=Anopheles triannulatus TaxID=58253 RepID=A0A2M4B1F8_9DIPT